MYGAGGAAPLSGVGTAAAVGATGTTTSAAALAYTGFDAMFFAIVAVTLLVAGFVLVRMAALRSVQQVHRRQG